MKKKTSEKHLCQNKCSFRKSRSPANKVSLAQLQASGKQRESKTATVTCQNFPFFTPCRITPVLAPETRLAQIKERWPQGWAGLCCCLFSWRAARSCPRPWYLSKRLEMVAWRYGTGFERRWLNIY